jgi:hypothetical protein
MIFSDRKTGNKNLLILSQDKMIQLILSSHQKKRKPVVRSQKRKTEKAWRFSAVNPQKTEIITE